MSERNSQKAISVGFDDYLPDEVEARIVRQQLGFLLCRPVSEIADPAIQDEFVRKVLFHVDLARGR